MRGVQRGEWKRVLHREQRADGESPRAKRIGWSLAILVDVTDARGDTEVVRTCANHARLFRAFSCFAVFFLLIFFLYLFYNAVPIRTKFLEALWPRNNLATRIHRHLSRPPIFRAKSMQTAIVNYYTTSRRFLSFRGRHTLTLIIYNSKEVIHYDKGIFFYEIFGSKWKIFEN